MVVHCLIRKQFTVDIPRSGLYFKATMYDGTVDFDSQRVYRIDVREEELR